MRPSFLYHQIHVPLVFLGAIILFYLLYAGEINFMSYECANLMFLFSIAIGIHALIHFDEEVYFDFNPMAGKSEILDEPIR